MSKSSSVLTLWNRLRSKPGGHWLFSRMVCFQAPYFATIRPRVRRLEPGRCEVAISKRRHVHNHIGTVHAIAMCNMAELAGGLMTDASIGPAYRWIPKGMMVEYKAKATTDLVAIAQPADPDRQLADGIDYFTDVSIRDTNAQEVMSARITMWVSAAGR